MRPHHHPRHATSPGPPGQAAPWPLRLATRWGVLLAALAVVGSASARMIEPEPQPASPMLPIIRHEATIRCDLDAERGPLTCTIRVIVEFSEPMPALIAKGLHVELFYHKRRWLPTSASADQRVLTFEKTFRDVGIDFTDTDRAISPAERMIDFNDALIQDVSAVEARHPLTVPRWMAPVFPISYRVPALWGAPLHLTVDLPDSVRPKEDLWLSLSFRDADPSRHVLTEDSQHPGFGAVFEGLSRWTWGGPLFGVACNLRAPAEDALSGCPTLIAGWEVSSPDWLLYQLVAEVDFTQALAFIPSVEAAGFLENVGFGFRVGLPVEVIPDPRVGLRALLTFSTWSVTSGFGVDVFPWQPSQGHILTPIFQVQLSL
jgi:hypothetical protein